jgi:hypothetical protein
MVDRIVAAGDTLTSGLAATDFAEREDSELFERIELTLAALRDSDGSKVSDATIDATATDILDLRDTIMGRAILEASRRHAGPDRRLAEHGSRWFLTDR